MGKKVVIFGAGGTGRRIYSTIKEQVEVLCFVDNDEKKWGGVYDNIEIKAPSILNNLKYDAVILGTLMGLHEVQEQFCEMKLDISLLDKTYVEISVTSRIYFLKRLAEEFDKNKIDGAVGEAGVYRGEFAKEINRFFPGRKCYLFDTFEGFDERDFKHEEKESLAEDAAHLKKTSEELVFEKMPYKDMVTIKKGYFPATAEGIEDKFCFINLDMDLYHPMYEGLKYFWNKMIMGGVILIHDYFSEGYPNVEKAVNDFEKEIGMTLCKMPIGDDISLAIIKR